MIALSNQKGGVGKTMTTIHLGIGMARQGKRVLLIDADPQGTMTHNLGFRPIGDLKITLATVLERTARQSPMKPDEGLLHHKEGVDLMPSNIQLSGMERDLTVSGNKRVLSRYLETVKSRYDYILIDCMPSLGAITLNCFTAADSVIIPMQAQPEATLGLQQLMQTIHNVRKGLNPKLRIEGILLTMVEERTSIAKTVMKELWGACGNNLTVFQTLIPKNVALWDTGPMGKSIYVHASKSKSALAYEAFTKEVLNGGNREKDNRSRANLLR
ncbi:ParA family protein [Anaerotruncus rubiinfantis]|uniref:ParA family protein n=1 Tax=Anaerotruncus rubiinfantis TaxID=1720200 RepID=UPI0034A2D035